MELQQRHSLRVATDLATRQLLHEWMDNLLQKVDAGAGER